VHGENLGGGRWFKASTSRDEIFVVWELMCETCEEVGAYFCSCHASERDFIRGVFSVSEAISPLWVYVMGKCWDKLN